MNKKQLSVIFGISLLYFALCLAISLPKSGVWPASAATIATTSPSNTYNQFRLNTNLSLENLNTSSSAYLSSGALSGLGYITATSTVFYLATNPNAFITATSTAFYLSSNPNAFITATSTAFYLATNPNAFITATSTAFVTPTQMSNAAYQTATTTVLLKVASNLSDLNSSSTARNNLGIRQAFQFIIEQPLTDERDFIFTPQTTSTLEKVVVIHKSTTNLPNPTLTWNVGFASSTRGTAATSTLWQTFTAAQTSTATTTASVLTPNGSTTLSRYAPLIFWTTGTASTSQVSFTFFYHEN